MDEATLDAAALQASPGTTETRFVAACERLGLRTTAIPVSAAVRRRLPLPLVLVGDCGQQVDLVVRRPTADAVDILDPTIGTVSTADLVELATHHARTMLVTPMAPSKPAGRTRLLRGPLVKVLVGPLAASCVINVLALAVPLYMMLAVDRVVGRSAAGLPALSMAALTVGVVVACLLDLALRVLRGRLSARAGARLEARLSTEVVHHLLQLPYGHFERTPSGVITERLRQLDTVRVFVAGQVPSLIVDLGFAGAFLGVILYLSWPVGLAVSAALPIFTAVSLVTRCARDRRLDESFHTLAAKSSALNEIIGNAVTVKALGLEAEMARRWRTHATRSASAGICVNALTAVTSAVTGSMQQILVLAVIVLGVQDLSVHRLSLGELMALTVLASRVLAPMRQVADAWPAIQSVRGALTRIDDLMRVPAEPETTSDTLAPAGPGELVLEGVSFRHDDEAPATLHDIDLRAAAGTVLGIVGPAGAGKSTIANLMQRLYSPVSGRILLDGTDIASLSRTRLRAQISSVSQDNQLFAGTVRDNIALGLAGIDPAEVVAVAKFVGAHRFIQRLPRGYDTVLGERGRGLSAGQRQLLCIARALIRNPRVLVLDEATSALDPASEELLLRALRANARGRTIVLISHRLAPLAIADTVALVIDGRIERCGPPTEVMAYARIRMAEASRAAIAAPATQAPGLDVGLSLRAG